MKTYIVSSKRKNFILSSNLLSITRLLKIVTIFKNRLKNITFLEIAKSCPEAGDLQSWHIPLSPDLLYYSLRGQSYHEKQRNVFVNVLTNCVTNFSFYKKITPFRIMHPRSSNVLFYE